MYQAPDFVKVEMNVEDVYGSYDNCTPSQSAYHNFFSTVGEENYCGEEIITYTSADLPSQLVGIDCWTSLANS